MKKNNNFHHQSQSLSQRGMTLIELMVGLSIGMLVVAVALGALFASRSTSTTVSEATYLQQQASYALRVIGQQIRQAGSLELNLNPNITMSTATEINAAMVPVAFDAPDPTGARSAFSRASSTLTPASSPVSVTVGYQNYEELATPIPPATTAATTAMLRDCLGQNPATNSGGSIAATPVLTSKFQRNTSTNELVCVGTDGGNGQPIIGNVTDFKVRYLQQGAGTANMQYVTNPSAADYPYIYAVEVCLEISGTETTPTSGATYKNCSDADTAYGDRMKLVFRNTFQIRSQGQTS